MKILNAVIAVRKLNARRERTLNTMRQLVARRRSVMDAIKTRWERRVDAVGTLWGLCVHAITDKFDILSAFCGDPTSFSERCTNAEASPFCVTGAYSIIPVIKFKIVKLIYTYGQKSGPVWISIISFERVK